MSRLDAFWASLGAAHAEAEPSREDTEAAVLAVMQFRRAGGAPPPWDLWMSWEPSTRAIWAEAGDRLESERIVALAACLSDPEALREAVRVTDPTAADRSEVSAVLDAAAARDRRGA